MSIAPPEILRCPPDRRAEALALVLCELAPSQRREIAKGLLDVEDSAVLANEALYVAQRGHQLCGAAWGQRQPGNIAVFWPPQLVAGEDEQTAYPLAESVANSLDDISIDMTQVLLSAPAPETIAVLRHIGFRHLADLLYLSCEAEQFPLAAPEPCEVHFVQYEASQRSRLTGLINRTYEGTLDCTPLNGVRDIDDVINGYQSTGTYRPENWLIAQSGGQDVGVLLLADHPQDGHWELMYMGLVPEVRGRGWGRQITRYAQWLARGAKVERIVVAVDATNSPAVATYQRTGFEVWERRAVYLRFRRSSRRE